MQKVILIGNLGKDPEVKSFENGGKIVNFTVGVTERGYKTKEGKEIPDHTEWFNCSVRQNGLAGVVEQYVKKGNKVYVEGKLRTREYEKDGQKKYLTELVVDNMECAEVVAIVVFYGLVSMAHCDLLISVVACHFADLEEELEVHHVVDDDRTVPTFVCLPV